MRIVLDESAAAELREIRRKARQMAADWEPPTPREVAELLADFISAIVAED